MTMTNGHHEPKTILVTGGAGYLGGTLIRRLAETASEEVDELRILDNLSNSSPRVLMGLPSEPDVRFFEADLLDPTAVERALDGVDTVVHLAAVVSTPFSFAQPDNITQVNQWGTVRLLDHCRDADVDQFVFASSASVYGPGEDHTEEDRCKPVGPYSHTKRQAEQAVVERGGDAMDVHVLRLGTLFGGTLPMIRFDAVPNKFAYLAGSGRSLTVFGTGEQQRPLVHVQDASDAILHTLREPEATSGIVNVVAENPSIETIAETVAGLADVPIRYTEQDYRDHITLSVDGSRFREQGWSPSVGLEDGLEEIVDEFRALAESERPIVDVP